MSEYRCKQCTDKCVGMCTKDWEPLPYPKTDWKLLAIWAAVMAACWLLMWVVMK